MLIGETHTLQVCLGKVGLEAICGRLSHGVFVSSCLESVALAFLVPRQRFFKTGSAVSAQGAVEVEARLSVKVSSCCAHLPSS